MTMMGWEEEEVEVEGGGWELWMLRAGEGVRVL